MGSKDKGTKEKKKPADKPKKPSKGAGMGGSGGPDYGGDDLD